MRQDTTSSLPPSRRWGAAATFCVAAAFSWGLASQSVMAPQPAQARGSLSGSTGATAAAIVLQTQPVPKVVKWPSGFTSGSTAPAGTPCSNIDLLPGEPVTMHIQVVGTSRRCVPTSFPPVGVQPATPAPTCANTTVVTQPTLNGAAQAVQVTPQPTTILKWQELWSTVQPTPAAGTACSTVDMQTGDWTSKHVQVWVAGSPWSRCVENTLPAYAN